MFAWLMPTGAWVVLGIVVGVPVLCVLAALWHSGTISQKEDKAEWLEHFTEDGQLREDVFPGPEYVRPIK